jgi:hypothetical protein
MNLSGASSISIAKGSTYTDPGIKVLEDTLNVTSSSTVAITVTNNTTGLVTNYDATSKIILDTSKLATYTIKYNVTYKEHNETLTRTVSVTE